MRSAFVAVPCSSSGVRCSGAEDQRWGRAPVDLAVRGEADRLNLAGVLADARQRHAAGTNARQIVHGARAINMAGSPLSHVATPITPRARQRADQPPQDDGRIVAVGQAVHHAGGTLRTAVAGVGAEAANGMQPSASVRRPPPGRQARADPSGRCGSRARQASRRGCGDRRTCSAAGTRGSAPGGLQPMPTFCVQPNRSPLGLAHSNSSVSGRLPTGPAAVVCVVQGGVGFEDRGQVVGGKGHRISRVNRGTAFMGLRSEGGSGKERGTAQWNVLAGRKPT